MKFKGIAFNKDIIALRKLRAKGDKEKFKKRMKETAAKYKTSPRTIYREMNKRKPGLRKTRKDAGTDKSKVLTKEKRMFKELREAGKTKTEAKKIVEDKLNKKISSRKLVKLDKKSADAETGKTSFADTFKDFVENYFDLELWNGDKKKPVKIGGVKFELLKDDANDIVLILINAFNRFAEAAGKKILSIDRIELTRAKLQHLLDARLRMAQESMNLKEIEQLTSMFVKLKVNRTNLPLEYKTLEAILKSFKPDITVDEIIALLTEYGEEK